MYAALAKQLRTDLGAASIQALSQQWMTKSLPISMQTDIFSDLEE